MTAASRRDFLRVVGLAGTAAATKTYAERHSELSSTLASSSIARGSLSWNPTALGAPAMRDPVWVYDNWSSYAEGVPALRDTRLTEELAMHQLDELARLKTGGVHFDYYMMNAFWFDPNGAYREWRKPDWPDGPDRWIASCYRAGLKPGMWFGTNSLWKINAAPQWHDSLAVKTESGWQWGSMSLFEGGFLSDFIDILQHWYGRGIRMFELDVADFKAATAGTMKSLSPAEISYRNRTALMGALRAFRKTNPDAMLVAFNGFGGDFESTAGPFPFKDPVDLRWLEVFDTLYSGDTRASDVPQACFWRSVDLYNDHMVRRFEQSGVPLERIDPFFTLSTTWFGYGRGKRAWKGMLLLTLARGSWKQTVYGSLHLLSDEDVRWFSKAQRMFGPLLSMGRTKTFGGIPGKTEPYGFGSFDVGGALYTIVNPAQEHRVVELPLLSSAQSPLREGRLLFRDAGYVPELDSTRVTLGPGQMVLIGYGRYANAKSDLGVQEDVIIPRSIRPLSATFNEPRSNVLEATLMPPSSGDVRVFFRQFTDKGTPFKDIMMKDYGNIAAEQGGQMLPVQIDLDANTVGIGGRSWSGCEIRRGVFMDGMPLNLRYTLKADQAVVLRGEVYAVEY